MFWVQRKSNRYLYRTRREGNKFRREYLGHGPVAEQRYLQDQRRRDAERAQRMAVQALLDRVNDVQGSVDTFAAWTRLLTEAVLIRSGYYHHQRSEWRRQVATPRYRQAKPEPADAREF